LVRLRAGMRRIREGTGSRKSQSGSRDRAGRADGKGVGSVVGAHSRLQLKESSDGFTCLVPGKPIERELGGKAVHEYLVQLGRGCFVQGDAEQKGIDVVVTVFDPGGRRLAAFDGPSGALGPEPFEIEPRTAGTYRIQISACDVNAPSGRYEISISKPLTPKQQADRLAARRVQMQAVSKWLAGNAIRLNTVKAGYGFADLQPLKNVIGDARIVALGEATHGTRDFFELKHRLIEFLVTEMGFTTFGIESPLPECFDINDYVLFGRGDPVKALAGQYYWMWDTKEVLAMIEWMRRYNADPGHTRKVKFYGFDMWFPVRAARVAQDYLRRVDPKYARSVAAEFGLLVNPLATNRDVARLPADRKRSRLAFIESILARLDAHKRDYIRKTGLEEWRRARQHARVRAQFDQDNLSDSADNTVRDPSMAENVAWILKQEGADSKIAIWAHNGHVGVNPDSMGYHLRRRFGSAMYSFGFAFNQGAFQAFEMTPDDSGGLRSFTVPPAIEGTLENLMTRAGLRIAAVDMRNVPKKGPVAEWFRQPCPMRYIGAGYPVLPECQSVDLRQTYDGIIFVEKTSAARPVSGIRRQPSPRLPAPANLDFEKTGRGGLPADWNVPAGQDNLDFRVVSSSEKPFHGRRCVEISRLAGRHYGEVAGTIGQLIEAKPYRGKKIRLRAAARAEVAGPGNHAELWVRCSRAAHGRAGVVSFDSLPDRPITSRKWRVYEIATDVGNDVDAIEYGFALIGDGKAWFDSVSIEAIGE
jgi:erythromycin esterase